MASNKVINAEQQNKHTKKLLWKMYVCKQIAEKYKYAY